MVKVKNKKDYPGIKEIIKLSKKKLRKDGWHENGWSH